MAKDPAVLFYTSDFLSGTQFLTNEECGKYIRLLCQQHQCGHIPKNHMINICGSDDSPVIKKFLIDSDGNYYNDRMEYEKLKRSSYCKSRSNNKSGRKTNKSYDNHTNNHMLVHMENENENKAFKSLESLKAFNDQNQSSKIINPEDYKERERESGLEAEEEEKEERRKTKKETCFSFEEFWEAYKKPVGKKTSIRLYEKVSEENREKIKEHLPKYASSKERQYRKDPERYLKHEAWNDEIINRDEKPEINMEDLPF
jgi:uncharacterized protein YdaU (DUF1376 family)